MKAHVLGFRWELIGEVAETLSLADLFTHMGGLRNVERDFNSFPRLIYVGETERYHTGLLLTAKTHRRFCELHRGDEALKINVREAEEGASLIDFNFFVMHKETGRGLYQYYHNSCSVGVFSRFCRRELGRLQAERIAAEIAAKGNDVREEEQERIYEKYEGDLLWQLLVRKENFETLVERMGKIASFEFAFATIEPEQEKLFRPLTGVSRVIKHRVTFNRRVTLAERKRAVMDMVRGDQVEGGQLAEAAVEGVDEDGLEKTVALTSNPDSFGHYEFDELAADMEFEPEKFQDSTFMQTLLALADENGAVLEGYAA